MDQKQSRCPDVAEAIIEHLREQCAVSTSNGIELSTESLAKAVGASQSAVTTHLRRLTDLKVVILKKGSYLIGSNAPKYFALSEKSEEGNDWKEIYYTGSSPTTRINSGPPLLKTMVEAGAKAAKDKDLLAELLRAYARNKELLERVHEAQEERNQALETVQRQQARIDELEQDLRATSESARTNQEEIAALDLQLREARSTVAHHERRMARNDEKRPQFATR